MADASERLLKIIKKTNVDTVSDYVSLTVKSINPLQLVLSDRIILDETFVKFNAHINKSLISVGDKFNAITLGGEQTYYVTDVISSTNYLIKYQGKLTAGTGIVITDNNTIYATGGSGTSNYNNLSNKPQINGVTLSGNKTTADLGIAIPTKTSDLTNDSNFIADANYTHTDNNYTTSEKNKLSGIAEGAEANVINSVKVNGTTQPVSNKAVNISVPTKTSDLTNDSNFVEDSSYVHTDNNYTSTEKTKLSGIENSAQVNKLETVKVNGTALTITDKAVDIIVPTKTSDITNDSNFVVDSNYVHSDNNFTTTLKNKLDGIAAGAEVNAISTIKVNDATQTITNKTVNISVPTNNNQLINGAGYQNATEVQTAIDNAISDITSFEFEVVQTLPATGVKGTIYLVSNSGSATNSYDEYIWVNNAWEKIGTTDIDLSNYMQFSDMVALTTEEINNIFTL